MALRNGVVTMILGLAATAGIALAQPDPSGIEFVTVGAPGNAAWTGNGMDGDMAIGRGSVGYEFKIGKFEVTTAQWVEFFNAAYDRPDASLPHLLPPNFWGAAGATPNNPGARRWSVPAGNEMRPVGNISWRMAAMYCNWLHNDKSTDRVAFLNGAYHVGTFGWAGIGFTDQLTHNPGAKYWIPTWDEWLKSAHYDQNKQNPDGSAGGWWTRPNGTDTPLAYGPPGVNVRTTFPPGPDPNGPLAQANAVWQNQFPGVGPFAIPLGSYPTVQSPWGLLDVAGGTREWTEYVFLTNDIWPTFRGFDGSAWSASASLDPIYTGIGGDFPNTATFDYGFRIAAAVPSMSACTFVAASGMLGMLRRRRQEFPHAQASCLRDLMCSDQPQPGSDRLFVRRRRPGQRD